MYAITSDLVCNATRIAPAYPFRQLFFAIAATVRWFQRPRLPVPPSGTARRGSSLEGFQECSGLFEIGRMEAFGKKIINRREKRACLRAFLLIAPETSEA
jgi:hypothetical protein